MGKKGEKHTQGKEAGPQRCCSIEEQAERIAEKGRLEAEQNKEKQRCVAEADGRTLAEADV